jgi:hypothetical protein
MARMIPLHIPASTESSAERRLFEEFRDACPAEWIVLHSLDLAQRGTGPFGEADFVVIAPGYGVMIIEAKTYLARTFDGLWLTSPKGEPQARGPFQQAGGAMHRVKDWIRQHGIGDVLATCVVVVPDMEITNKDQIEWAPWQLIDRPRYRSKSLTELLVEAFEAQKAALENPPGLLTPQTAERIVRVLRGEVECYVSPKARIASQLADVKRYTAEQFRVLDQMGDNPRLLIDGLAGTGKTLLAIESARRAVESGRTVLFVCFNRLLGEWLAEETAPLGEACRTTTIHEFMQSIVGDTGPSGLPADYYENDLPERVFNALDAARSAGTGMVFDELVIDEAQDILINDSFLSVLDSVLAQGLAGGRWRLFGDFQHQDIFGRGGESPRTVLEKLIGSQPPLVALKENCRNLPRVAHLAGQLGGVVGGYREWRREDDGFDPRIVFYDGAKTARKALIDALDTLVAEGFEPGQIVVLSRRSVANCLAATIDAQPWGDRLKESTEAGGSFTGYDSVFRFKGLEAPAVVVTDIDPLESEGRWSDTEDVRSLLYVAVTRALSRVVVVAHEYWRERLDWTPMDETGLDPKDVAATLASP